MLRRGDVRRAYRHAMLQRVESQTHRPVLPSDLRGTRLVELTLQSGNALVGKSLVELHLPPETLVVAIERQSETIIPRGDTRLEDADRLQILVRDDRIAELHEHLLALPGQPCRIRPRPICYR